MKTLKIIFSLTFVFFLLFSCKEKSKGLPISEKSDNFEPKVEFAELEKDFMKWWTYHSNTISLSTDFEGFDTQSNKIDKTLFLETLTSGKFIPLRLNPIDGIEHYKLLKLDAQADESIATTIKNTGITYLHQYKMEGTSFPDFDVIDLDGNHYSNESIKGKTILFKTWFIKCHACVAEFPELNAFVKTHPDMTFVSLALDSDSELKNFLETKKFEYETVAEQEEFIRTKLKLNSYPTHIIVDENGIILKVVGKASEMISFLDGKQNPDENRPTPPPPM